jgi:hypothetical protein
MTFHTRLAASALALAVAAACLPAAVATGSKAPVSAGDIASLVKLHTAQPITMSVYGTGLINPRGLKFGPDGNLYVAEGGPGGSDSTTPQQCMQVPGAGPYTGSPTGGRISKIDRHHVRTTVTDAFPSSQTNPGLGSLVSGVADVAFIGHTMYALLAGAGCSHGVIGTVNGVARVAPDGSSVLIANLSAYQMSHPVQNSEPDDFEPDGTWYSMLALRGNLYAVEPNHGELVRITPGGSIKRIADISASQGHIVPTALAYHGNFYVGNLNTFPIVEGSSKVIKITPSGQVRTVANGLTTVLGLAFDRRGRMYVLENTTGAGNIFPTPGTGDVVRIEPNGLQQRIITGLVFPTGMTFGPDGALYISNMGFGFPPTGMGQVLRFELGD